MKKKIDISNIKKFNSKFNKSQTSKLSRNALIRNDINNVSINWDNFRKINHNYSNLISRQLPVTNQKASGRCWGFAGLNLLRLNLVEKYNLLAKEALTSGDRTLSENYYQHADHFMRIVYEKNLAQKQNNSQINESKVIADEKNLTNKSKEEEKK